MYRDLILLLLFISSLLAAPQKESKITFVKRQIDQTASQSEENHTSKETKIEDAAFTVPVTINEELMKTEDVQQNEPTNTPLYNYSDRIYSIKTKPKKNDNSTKNKLVPVESVTTANFTDVSDEHIFQLESVQTETLANDTIKYETDVTAIDVTLTEKYEDLTTTTEIAVETTKAPPAKFLPKLSHYGKSTINSFSQNLIATTSKRRFRSRCRCEKIWNCAKLQISVPRCPEEYFLCCS